VDLPANTSSFINNLSAVKGKISSRDPAFAVGAPDIFVPDLNDLVESSASSKGRTTGPKDADLENFDLPPVAPVAQHSAAASPALPLHNADTKEATAEALHPPPSWAVTSTL
jgi:hypothetical protein